MGINKGSVQVDLFQEWCEKNNVKCQVELYESSEQRYADMNSGKLDAIVSTTVAEKEISKYLWNSIVKIGYFPYYFAVSKKSPELYDEMETALLQGEVDTIFPVYGSYWIAEDYANPEMNVRQFLQKHVILVVLVLSVVLALIMLRCTKTRSSPNRAEETEKTDNTFEFEPFRTFMHILTAEVS